MTYEKNTASRIYKASPICRRLGTHGGSKPQGQGDGLAGQAGHMGSTLGWSWAMLPAVSNGKVQARRAWQSFEIIRAP